MVLVDDIPGEDKASPVAADLPALDRAPRVALAVFVIVEIGAAVLFLVQGRDQWFVADEWEFLVTRTMNVDDVFQPHVEHWTTVPILSYRGLWTLFGIRTYLPYQALLVASHLGIATLLRVIMRRAGVGPWLATLAASVIALFGSGNENITWAFQITFSGALLFGLVHLVLADHDGSIDRRDWLGLSAGLLAIMCSGPGLVMVAVVGATTLLRRGWRPAIFHTVPLAGIYGLWAIVYGEQSNFSEERPGAGDVLAFVNRGVSATFEALGQLSYVGWVLAAGLVLGLVLTWTSSGFDRIRRGRIGPMALLVGAVLLLTVTAIGRAGFYGAERATESRYLYMVAAMAMPAVALALDTLVRRWRWLSPVVVMVLLVGVPGNIAAADDQLPRLRVAKRLILALPSAPNAGAAPDSRLLGIDQAERITLGWLKTGVAEGRVPSPSEVSPSRLAEAQLWLGLQQRRAQPPLSECPRLTEPVERRLAKGDSLTFEGGVLEVSVLSPTGPLGARLFDARKGTTIFALTDLPPLVLEPTGRRAPTVC